MHVDGPRGERLVLWESAAILLHHLRQDGALLPDDPAARAHCHQWLFWQMSYLGPMMGQLQHFVQYAADAG